MQAGEVENVAANGVLATIPCSTEDYVTIAVVTIVTAGGFDGTLTFKKRQNRANRPNNTQGLTATACAYEKQSDKTLGTTPIVPGSGVTQMYNIDVTGSDLLPEITTRTVGTISMYWDVVLG